MPHKIRDMPAALVVNATTNAQDLFRTTIRENTLGTNRRVRLSIDGTLTTPLVGLLPELTLTIGFGTETITLGSAALVLVRNITNHPFSLEVTLRGNGSGTSQRLKAVLIERMTVPPTTKLANTILEMATFSQNQSTPRDLYVRSSASILSQGTVLQVVVSDLDILD